MKLTNIYPYYIDTGLFSGFSPWLSYIIPTLSQFYVAKWMYHAIMTEVDEFHIYWFNPYIKMIGDLLPLRLKNYLIRISAGNGMKGFVARRETHIKID